MEQIIEQLERIEALLRAAAPTLYVDTQEASRITGISTVTLEKWRTTGEGPKFVKLSRAVRYRTVDLQEYMDAHLVTPLSVDR